MGEKTKTIMSTTTSSSSASPLENSKPVALEPPHGLLEPMEFLARTWSVSALEGSKTVFPSPPSSAIPVKLAKQSSGNIEESNVELEDPSSAVMGSPLSFATPSLTSQLVLERIMSQTQQQQQDVSPRTSGRLSHSSGPLNTQSCGGPPIDSPPLSPSHVDDLKFCRLSSTVQANYKGKTVGRWLKDRREKKKETRTQNAQVHAAVSVACVAAAVAAFAAATAASSKDEQSKTNMAVSSAATLVAAQCVEAAESLGADREHLTAVINSAVNVRTAGDIMTLTAAAALRGAATLKARALNDVWNIAAVVSVEKGTVKNNNNNHHSSFSDELAPEDNSFGVCSQELLARGGELLKRTRNGDLHWKLVSVYINREGEVALKMKSRHVAGTITKKKKKVVLDVCKNVEAWPGRHLLTGGENRRYFGLRTGAHRVIEFECRNQKEYELWTKGISRLLTVAREKKPLA